MKFWRWLFPKREEYVALPIKTYRAVVIDRRTSKLIHTLIQEGTWQEVALCAWLNVSNHYDVTVEEYHGEGRDVGNDTD